MTNTQGDVKELEAVSPWVLALRAELANGSSISRGSFGFGKLTCDVAQGKDTLWAILRRPEHGGLAIRLAYAPGGIDRVKQLRRRPGEKLRFSVHSAMGRHVAALKTDGLDVQRLRVTMELTPAAPLLLPCVPRDLYPLDAQDDPAGTAGRVEAAQRGLNAGLLYFHVDTPALGSVLYFQNLTAMNAY